jgi:RNA ligase
MTYHPIASAFPFVNDLEIFRAQVGEKEEIRYMLQDNGYTVVSYVVSSESTFDNLYALECRGIVFDSTGKLVARPLTKFFNMNEKPSTQVAALDWTKVVRVMDKRDGSMIHTVRVTPQESPFELNTFTLKSKKSFKSDVAVQALAWMKTRQNFIDFCQSVTEAGMTAIFEWTSPTARIVLPYQQDELQLLHIRENSTGRYLNLSELELTASAFGVQVVETTPTARQLNDVIRFCPSSMAEILLKLAETEENIEGWVVQFEDGNMVKVKTKWYLERHRAMTFLRERDIVGAVLNESLDDLKAMLVGEGVCIDEIVAIEEQTVSYIRGIESELDITYAQAMHMTKKEAALRFGPAGEKLPLFSLLMHKMDGKEPDIKGWYQRNVLPTIPLRQLNLLQSVAEVE